MARHLLAWLAALTSIGPGRRAGQAWRTRSSECCLSWPCREQFHASHRPRGTPTRFAIIRDVNFGCDDARKRRVSTCLAALHSRSRLAPLPTSTLLRSRVHFSLVLTCEDAVRLYSLSSTFARATRPPDPTAHLATENPSSM